MSLVVLVCVILHNSCNVAAFGTREANATDSLINFEIIKRVMDGRESRHEDFLPRQPVDMQASKHAGSQTGRQVDRGTAKRPTPTNGKNTIQKRFYSL